MADFRFHLIVGTDAIMTRLLESISQAKTVIRIQFFTFEGDTVGKKIALALIEKAKQGVKVEFLCDDFSNWKINDKWLFTPHTPRTYISLIKEWYQTQKMRLLMQFNGISLRLTNPLNFFKLRASLSARDHRKLVVIDDRIAFTGGFNLSEHNLGWHDTFTEIHDKKVIASLKAIFDDSFNRKHHQGETEVAVDTKIFHTTNSLVSHMRDLISRATKHVYIESPYFSDKKIVQLLTNKSKSSLAKAVIIPQRNNIRYIARIHRRYRKLYPALFKRRIRPTPMLHAKHALIDDYAIFGSSNFLYSKMIDNHQELSLVTTDGVYVKELHDYFTSALQTQCI